MTAAGALDGLRVVELVDEPVEYCGRLLAGLGADVIKLEPPEGAPSRHVGPYVDGREGDLDASLNFWHFNVGKRSAVVPDDETIRRVCASADVVIHTLRRPSGRSAARPRIARRGEPRTHRLRHHAVRAHRSVGGLPRRRPRAHGARWVDGGLRVRHRRSAAGVLGRSGVVDRGDLRRDRRARRARAPRSDR